MGRLAVVGGADLLRQAGGRAAGCAVADGCRRWALAAGCCCEVWRCRCAGNGQAVQLMGCGVIWCGGLLLAWSSGAALAVLILPGAGGGRCDLLRLRCAGVVIVATAATPSACRSADPAGRAGGRRAGGRRRKRKRPGRRRVVRCCSGLLSALAVRSAAPGASRCISWAVAVCSPFRCRAAGAGTDPGATVPAGNVPAWHGLRWRCSIRCVFAVRRRGQILHLTG